MLSALDFKKNRIFTFLIFIFILFNLYACSEDYYPNKGSCSYVPLTSGGIPPRYFYNVSFKTKNDEELFQGTTSVLAETHRIKRISVENIEDTFYIFNPKEHHPRPSYEGFKNELLNNGYLFIGWEDSEGNLIDELNPLVIDFDECYENPIVLYARTREVSLFYRIIRGTAISDELANLTFNQDIDGVFEYFEYLNQREYTDQFDWIPNRIFHLMRVMVVPRDRNLDWYDVDKEQLEKALFFLNPIIDSYDSSYFVFMRELIHSEYVWDRIRIYRDRIQFDHQFTINATRNQSGGISFTLYRDLVQDHYRLEIRSYTGSSCSPSLSNCQTYRGPNAYLITWRSSDKELVNPRLWSTGEQKRRLRLMLEEINLMFLSANMETLD